MNSQDSEVKILLIKACNENNKEATETLYIKLRPDTNKCHNSCWQQDSDDCFQEFFLRILNKQVNYKGNGNPIGFINNTLKNIHLELFNNNKFKYQSWQGMERDGIFPVDKEICKPSQVLENNELRRIIRKAISELPPKSRQAIELVLLNGLSPKEAAELIGCDFKIFRKRLDYGKKRLCKYLEKYILS